VFLSAALPPRRAVHRLEGAFVKLRNRWSSDAALRRRLRGLGGFDGETGADETARLMRRFRVDVEAALDAWSAAYAARAARVQAPTLLIFGDQDPFTRAFARRARAWSAFVAAPQIACVPDGGHYFLKHHAGALAGIIIQALAPAPTTSGPGPGARGAGAPRLESAPELTSGAAK
jgi:surfactin synthase thioesterase subunit